MNQYLECTYRDGGRGPTEYDCWGICRHVRHFELGLKLLPEYGSLRNTSPRDFTKAYRTESHLLRECGPEHGAIAAVLIGEICVHVALVLVVEGRFKILEINPTRGPRVLPLEKWLRDHNRVTFHND
ncbi:hypothetical protein D3C80_1742860 [compost metagenome]